MSEERKKLQRLLALHNRARDSIVPNATPEEVREIDNGFLAYLMISTHSRIAERNRKIGIEFQWGKEKIQALIKYLCHFTMETEDVDSKLAQAVESYLLLRGARNRLAHNDIRATPLPHEWSAKDVMDHCGHALEFPRFLREYAEKHVQRARNQVGGDSPPAP